MKFMRRVWLASLIVMLLGLATDHASAAPRHHKPIHRQHAEIRAANLRNTADEVEDVRDSLQDRLSHMLPGSDSARRLQERIDDLDEVINDLDDDADKEKSMDSDDDGPVDDPEDLS